MTRESDSIAKRLETKINYKIIAMMVAFTIAYYVYGYLNQEYVINNFTVLNIPFLTIPLGVGIAGIIVAKRYWKTEIFGKAYLSLGIAYILWWLGSSVYEYYSNFTDITPYPSLADVFFIALFPFLYYHLILNTKRFYKLIKKSAKVSIWILPVALVILYTSITLPAEGTSYDLDFYLPEIYIVNEAVLLALVILGALVFRHSMLGNVWVLLVIGLSIFTFADYWYYYAEVYGQYDKSHPSNAIWQLSFMILIYALYKHKKVI